MRHFSVIYKSWTKSHSLLIRPYCRDIHKRDVDMKYYLTQRSLTILYNPNQLNVTLHSDSIPNASFFYRKINDIKQLITTHTRLG